MSHASAYIDVPEYLRAATNLETASLLGLNTTLDGEDIIPAGTTALPVADATNWAAAPLWLLDGPVSEMVRVTGSSDGTHLTLAAPGTAFAHAPGVSVSQAGTDGALAELLLRASAWVENYCRQGVPGDRSLYAASRTERWAMPGTRAWLDRDGVLAVRPGHFPVQSVAALTVEMLPGKQQALDASLVELASSGRMVEAPLAAVPGGLGQFFHVSRTIRRWVTLTYTGGITPGEVPYDLRQACIWVASELLAQRRNPTGAALIRQGKFELQARPLRETTGDSIHIQHAKAALEPYRA